MSKYIYSLNEDFSEGTQCYEIEDCLDEVTEDTEEVLIYRGELIEPNVAKYIPDIMEAIQELAYDECWDSAVDAYDCSKEQSRNLQEEVSAVVEKFLSDNKIIAGFFDIENVIALKYLKTGKLDPHSSPIYEQVEDDE